MKTTTYVVLIVLLIASCKTTKLPKQKPVEETKIEDFKYFVGLSKGDLVEKALNVFGTPSKSNKDKKDRYSFFTNYYHDEANNQIVSYSYDKETNVLNHIRLRGAKKFDYNNTKKFIIEKGIKDTKINFLGMHKDKIFEIMGEPDRINSGHHEYQSGPLNVTFICYSFHNDKCSEIYLFWNHKYSKKQN